MSLADLLLGVPSASSDLDSQAPVSAEQAGDGGDDGTHASMADT